MPRQGGCTQRSRYNEWRRWRLPEVRSEEGAHAGAVLFGRGAQRVVTAGDIVDEGQLIVPRVGVADDRDVAKDDQVARA